MKSDRYRPLLLAACVAGIALVGCSSQPATTQAHASAATSTKGAATRPATVAPKKAAESALPSSTGIPACDDYLASYVACHRAANIFTPDQVEPRYETMRTNLLRDSQDPAVRPQLGARCTALATSLREALHGKSCSSAEPIPPASTTDSH